MALDNRFDIVLENYDNARWRVYGMVNGRKDIDPEDLVQEATLRAYRSLGTMDINRNVGSWFLTIASNLVKDFYRKEGSGINPIQFPASDEEDYFDPVSAEPSPSYAFEDFDRLEGLEEILRDAMSHLDPRYREVIQSYYLDEQSSKEISKRMGTSVRNVGVLIWRARKKLEKIILLKNNGNIEDLFGDG